MPASAAHPWKTLPVSMLTYLLLTQPLFWKKNYALPGNSMPSLPKGRGSDLASSVNSVWGHALTLQEGFHEWAWSRPLGGKLFPKILASASHRGLVPSSEGPLPRTDAGTGRADGLTLSSYPLPSHHRTQDQRSPQFSSTGFLPFTISFIHR